MVGREAVLISPVMRDTNTIREGVKLVHGYNVQYLSPPQGRGEGRHNSKDLTTFQAWALHLVMQTAL